MLFSLIIPHFMQEKVHWINVGKLPIILNRGIAYNIIADTLLGIIAHGNDSGKKT
jgi:hypothetical protein